MDCVEVPFYVIGDLSLQNLIDMYLCWAQNQTEVYGNTSLSYNKIRNVHSMSASTFLEFKLCLHLLFVHSRFWK